MKILVVEDQRKAADFLQRGLREHNYSVDIAREGAEALYMALYGDYDLIILDVMLPERDGWSILTELRRAGKNTLTLFLTARSGVDDRIKGLDLGADAYLVKPIAFSELTAQIRSLLRRAPGQEKKIVRFADLELDVVHRTVSRGGKAITLTLKEFQMLWLLVRKAGEVLSRTTIAEQVWDMNFDNATNVVDVHIGRIRAKVDTPFGEKIIHTVRGIGYVIRREAC